MTLTDEDLERIDEKIRSLAENALSNGETYLLSRLGMDLGDDLKQIKLKYGRPLAQYIDDRLGSDFTIVRLGSHENIQALARSDNAGVQTYSAPVARKADARFNYRFWAAFSVPLAAEVRWLNLDDFTFEDQTERPSGDYIDVAPIFVAPADADDRDNVVKSNISKWLEEKKLPQSRFLARPPSTPRPLSTGRSLLEVLVETLDRKQLASTTMSLDVIAELLRKRV